MYHGMSIVARILTAQFDLVSAVMFSESHMYHDKL